MIENIEHVPVFLASPTDTTEERDLIEQEIINWNRREGKKIGVMIETRRWESHAPVGSEKGPQTIINEELLKEAELLIGLFWTKFCSSGSSEKSNTMDEIQYFLEKKRPVIMYIIDKPVGPSVVNPKDLEKINDYKVYLQDNNHTYRSIKSNEDIKNHLYKDLEYNLSRMRSQERASSVEKRKDASNEKTKQWFEHSIKAYIDKYLRQSGFKDLFYRRELTYSENCLLWQAKGKDFNQVHLDSLNRVREQAFDSKYGNYDYSRDLRSLCSDEWYEPITRIVEKSFSNIEKIDIIGVASNDGTELTQIFENSPIKTDVTVLEFSSIAISKGKKKNPEFTFIQGNMERSPLRRESYDLYLNLRSIHSRGVDMRQTFPECFRILKPGGIAVFSISDGYLVETNNKGDLKEQRGMYDSRNKVFLMERPRAIVEKVVAKLLDFGFVDYEIHSGKSEIFIIVRKAS